MVAPFVSYSQELKHLDYSDVIGKEEWEQLQLEYRNHFYKELNSYRKRKLKRPLVRSEKLECECLEWLKEMGTKMRHDPSLRGSAEVLAYGPAPLIHWQESKPHNNILLNKKMRTVGFAFYKGFACARLKR